MVGKEFAYLIDFAEDGKNANSTWYKQLRALWTAFCLHWGLDCDTLAYDTCIGRLWEAVEEGSAAASCPCFEKFDLYMGTQLC